jgi:GTP 3',8-cyclase
MLTNIVHRWSDIQKLRAGEMIYPSFVDFHSTNVCNQHCTGCAYDQVLETQIMPEARQFQAIDTFLEVGVKAFDFAGGGEPTLAPYLAKAMRYIADRGGHFALITNGVKMSDELMDVLVEHGTYLRVSLEASSPEDYKAYKKTPDWHWTKVLENIREVIRRRNAANSQLEVSLKFLVGKPLRGRKHYENMRNLVADLGPDRVNVKALVHEPDELTLREKVNEASMAEFWLADTPNKHVWIVPKYDATTHPQCWLTPVHAMLEWNGDLMLCCFWYYREEQMKIGNIWTTPFRELWMSELHKMKIAQINKADCAKVFCKFGAHTESINQMDRRGAGYWI